MDTVTELFKHPEPLAWVIGSITLIVIAVLAVNRKIFSENKLFSLVLVAILLIVTVYLFSPSSDGHILHLLQAIALGTVLQGPKTGQYPALVPIQSEACRITTPPGGCLKLGMRV
ncbi:MAG: hypothetical protein SF053_21610 [Bacteroidia bacterium]|nr:hypothetical protein [Bacteroidia bacterium]